jgi:hypothetical protein
MGGVAAFVMLVTPVTSVVVHGFDVAVTSGVVMYGFVTVASAVVVNGLMTVTSAIVVTAGLRLFGFDLMRVSTL